MNWGFSRLEYRDLMSWFGGKVKSLFDGYGPFEDAFSRSASYILLHPTVPPFAGTSSMIHTVSPSFFFSRAQVLHSLSGLTSFILPSVWAKVLPELHFLIQSPFSDFLITPSVFFLRLAAYFFDLPGLSPPSCHPLLFYWYECLPIFQFFDWCRRFGCWCLGSSIK